MEWWDNIDNPSVICPGMRPYGIGGVLNNTCVGHKNLMRLLLTLCLISLAVVNLSPFVFSYGEKYRKQKHKQETLEATAYTFTNTFVLSWAINHIWVLKINHSLERLMSLRQQVTKEPIFLITVFLSSQGNLERRRWHQRKKSNILTC